VDAAGKNSLASWCRDTSRVALSACAAVTIPWLAFVAAVTAAAIGAITGAVIVLAARSIVDWLTALMALVTIGLIWKVPKLPEPLLVAVAAIIGLVAFSGVRA